MLSRIGRAILPSDSRIARLALVTLGGSAISAVFWSYYIKVFLVRFRVSDQWFHISQLIFLIWNPVNDPLFAYWQDRGKWCSSRGKSISYSAPLFGLAFLSFWWPWSGEAGSWLLGVQLTTALCLYDGVYTWWGLAHCALSAELSTSSSVRLQVARYSALGQLIGVLVLLPLNYASNSAERYAVFQWGCVAVAIAGSAAIYAGGAAEYGCAQLDSDGGQSKAESGGNVETPSASSANVAAASDTARHAALHADGHDAASSLLEPLRLGWSIVRQRNFLAFVSMNFLQIFHQVFLASFLIIFLQRLIGHDHALLITVVVTACNFLPALCVILFLTDLASWMGSYRVCMWSFVLKILCGVAMLPLVLGRGDGLLSGWAAALLVGSILVQALLANAISGLFNVLVADIVDDDFVRQRRRLPLSSMLFGVNALLTKPAQSVAPMGAVAYLSAFGYRKVTQTDANDDEVRQAMLRLLCLAPVAVGALQLIVFAFYTLRETHSHSVIELAKAELAN